MRTIIYGVINRTNNEVVFTNGNIKKAEARAEELRKENPNNHYIVGHKWVSI